MCSLLSNLSATQNNTAWTRSSEWRHSPKWVSIAVKILTLHTVKTKHIRSNQPYELSTTNCVMRIESLLWTHFKLLLELLYSHCILPPPIFLVLNDRLEYTFPFVSQWSSFVTLRIATCVIIFCLLYIWLVIPRCAEGGCCCGGRLMCSKEISFHQMWLCVNQPLWALLFKRSSG